MVVTCACLKSLESGGSRNLIGWLKRRIAERELAAVLKRFGAWVEEELMGPKAAAGAFGGAAAIVVAVAAQVSAACPDLAAQWPQLVAAGVMAGFGKWMHSRRSE